MFGRSKMWAFLGWIKIVLLIHGQYNIACLLIRMNSFNCLSELPSLFFKNVAFGFLDHASF